MQHTSSASAFSIADVRGRLKCRIVGPDDVGYDELRTVFSGGIDNRPAVIIRPASAADVADVVTIARDSGLPFAIRNGGHNPVGHSMAEGGIVLDTRDMRALSLDATNRTVWAGAGLTAGEYTKELGAHGLATGFGDTGSVGIAGITLGGGIGYLTRKHGMTIDSLIGAEIVTADGQILQIDADSHPDLFWAIRGGGGNFGVVTKLRFQLQPVDQVYGGMLMLPASAENIVKVMDAAERAPEELTAIVNVMPAPPMPFVPKDAQGKLCIMILMCYAGDADAGTKAVAPFRAVAQPIVDMVRPIKYPEIYPPDDPSYRPKAVSRTMFLNTVDRATAETIVDTLQRSDAMMRVTQLRVLGGAMARVPNEATAFAHRDSRIMAVVAAFFTSPEDKLVREAWAREFLTALDQGHAGAYVNFLADEGEARVRAAYPGSTWSRLAAIKARYDPQNVFRLNQNISPRAQQAAS